MSEAAAPEFTRIRALMVWLAETARHGGPRESRWAVEVLAAMDGAQLTYGARRWLEVHANGADRIKREWARELLLRLKGETTCN